MKKIFFSMMALSIAAFTFTSCEDVPEPYNNPYDQIKPSEPEVVIEPAGSGTATDPYNVAAIIEQTASLADGEFFNNSEDVYVTGIVTETTDISATYKNATYYISDDAKGSNRFYVYRGKLLDGADVEADTDLQVGDSVTVCGKIKSYKGTMEFDQGNKLVFYKKGEGGSSETPATPGTVEKPLTVAEALAYTNALAADKQSPVGYVKGKICAIKEVDTGQYGNATYSISDDGTEDNALQVYRGYSLNGEKFKAADEIKVGDEVIITGKLVNYKGNTPQFAQGNSIYSLNGKTSGGQGGGEGGGTSEGQGTANAPYNVTAALAAASGTGVYVKGFIVGYIDGKSINDAKFTSAENAESVPTNLILAASANETDIAKCMPIQLPAGAVRTALNLKENSGNLKKEVTLYGNIEKYFSVTGLKSVTFAILNGTEIGTNPNGGSGEGGDATAFYSIDFKATGSKGDWTIDIKSKDEALTDVWTFDSRYGMKASAFANSTCYASEAWLISPAIDLSKATKATLKLHQALNKFTDIDTSKSQCKVLVSTDGNQWTELNVTGWPESLSWTFVDSSADLSAFAGKSNVKIALKYTSSVESAGTWEVDVITVE